MSLGEVEGSASCAFLAVQVLTQRKGVDSPLHEALLAMVLSCMEHPDVQRLVTGLTVAVRPRALPPGRCGELAALLPSQQDVAPLLLRYSPQGTQHATSTQQQQPYHDHEAHTTAASGACCCPLLASARMLTLLALHCSSNTSSSSSNSSRRGSGVAPPRVSLPRLNTHELLQLNRAALRAALCDRSNQADNVVLTLEAIACVLASPAAHGEDVASRGRALAAYVHAALVSVRVALSELGPPKGREENWFEALVQQLNTFGVEQVRGRCVSGGSSWQMCGAGVWTCLQL